MRRANWWRPRIPASSPATPISPGRCNRSASTGTTWISTRRPSIRKAARKARRRPRWRAAGRWRAPSSAPSPAAARARASARARARRQASVHRYSWAGSACAFPPKRASLLCSTTRPIFDESALMNQPTAIVTGGSRGIGRAIATELAKTHRVIATYRGRKDAADALREETGCEIFQCDISSREDRAALLAFARQRFERLDLLVNNAGMAPRERRDLLEATEESFDELIATNLKGPHFLSQQAARWMTETTGGAAGRIVFVTSISAYAAS